VRLLLAFTAGFLAACYLIERVATVEDIPDMEDIRPETYKSYKSDSTQWWHTSADPDWMVVWSK